VPIVRRVIVLAGQVDQMSALAMVSAPLEFVNVLPGGVQNQAQKKMTAQLNNAKSIVALMENATQKVHACAWLGSWAPTAGILTVEEVLMVYSVMGMVTAPLSLSMLPGNAIAILVSQGHSAKNTPSMTS